ncbi:CHAT domain-containing protein [Geodermatophilus siccatus]|uniref:CHAT domain-containing protein n=1 Tax=Geodermatophilus siccatus TaxID=1137991 RepID=A0A1G9QHG6_9ACTN|nr:CHAT domain-containing protein [Geodermatophilus siccatus]SDM10443.1 CHAT domain-containing protein [Geodermatophilus siccatus]
MGGTETATREIQVRVLSSGEVDARRDDGATWQGGSIQFSGVDAELIRIFARWLTERGREWRWDEVRAFGSLLHRSLFPAGLWSWVEQSMTEFGDSRLRLQLEFPSEGLADLAAVPWEYLHVPNRPGREGFFLAADHHVILTRFVQSERGRRALGGEPRISVLVLTSQPQDLGEVIAGPVVEQLEKLRREKELPLDVVVLEQPSRSSLRDQVQETRPHVVHFIGHGQFDAEHAEGQIALVGGTGRADWVGEQALAQLLDAGGTLPRLTLFHSCAGAQVDYRASFAGLAPRLIKRGVQCVVAMQYAVTNRTALEFARIFYDRLGRGLPVDEAVQAGRMELHVIYGDDSRLLGIPVIYLNSRDAVLLPPTTPSPSP